MPITLEPIGAVRSSRSAPIDDNWDAESARIELDPARCGPDALLGLDQFSHVEVLFVMDRVPESAIERGARHPRDNPAWPRLGIFAQRGKNRPNRIGATVCRVVAVRGLTLEVAGLDAVDGSPVLDLKPWMAAFGPRGEVVEPAWVAELMRAYWRG
ncbi:MAG: SAM-dependent methyltransferase [Polyangiaceae bacterium]|nr:SAM-dependent methyltransferase [Polyangiaceae bacterium]